MHLTRRQFAILACALTVPAGRGAAASEDNAVFWQANLADRSIAIFGYERISAALVSDIVRDGERISDQASSVYTDIGPNAPHLKYSTNIKQVPPVLPDLTPADADDLRRIIPAAAGSPVERLPGYVVALLLMGEGQHSWAPSVEGVIMDHVRSGGKQISPLISDTDLMSIWSPPDTFTLKAVGAHQISYLLEKRRQLGPIGGYMETLYRQRRVSEITQLREEIAKEGVVSPLGSLAGPQFKALLLKQVLKIDSTKNFLLLPLAVLLGNDGILELMKSNGFQITALA
ncbi:hypothetical protein G6M50_11650 [Agrobacterium rhizogenes]|nr:hypothetical protein [Rhizobium rhizogenes]NTJ78439.1 hypothetical protein [Rhizobium rhizogenes]